MKVPTKSLLIKPHKNKDIIKNEEVSSKGFAPRWLENEAKPAEPLDRPHKGVRVHMHGPNVHFPPSLLLCIDSKVLLGPRLRCVKPGNGKNDDHL